VQQSSTYIIVFSAILTIVCGGLLALANQGLKPMQDRAVELDTKSKILSAVMDVKGIKGNKILDVYAESIEAITVNLEGEIIEKDEKGNPIVAEKVDVAKNYKLAPENRLLPVFIYHKPGDKNAVEAYVFPVYGKGLWGPIWGFIALETDLNTIKGASYDHKSETPGLGARISGSEISDRYIGKKLFDDGGELLAVVMLKGEKNPEKLLDDHHVDGMSGSTLTGKGMNAMIQSYFSYYMAFINTTKSNAATPVAAVQ
jgi:Na+-transporting NADH:ubiquinone oxidoreductase subunit C